MLARLRFSTIQSGLVLFWAIWFSVVTLTNFADAMQQVGALPPDFGLASHNFDLVRETVGARGVPSAIAAGLFACILFWEFLASCLFWRAWRTLLRGGNGAGAEVTQAFAISLALWAAFLIATEVTVNYTTAATHKMTLIAQLATLLVVRSGATSSAVQQ